ncbi:hypothetical protein CY34DRAFT_10982 [Suillus luteus UH-Slu-Lm8-n1]|uniref:Uncharacterized protein n=1 Tax=Suillus luteus UH-Slu-Lm8-n1 TaxID=930992 RepID=A0A0D0BEM1_9AGAM|nr:hypothetical protein CY34DRAFT_10982 [Suillus luteus UH-Slu-Lm8-n1]
MQYPGQFGGVDDIDELSPAFFAGLEADVDTSALSPQWAVTIIPLLLHSSLASSSPLYRFRPNNNESTKLPRPSRPSVFHIHALLACLSSLTHSSPSDNDAPPSLFPYRSRLTADEEAESHPTTSLSSRSDFNIRDTSCSRNRSRTTTSIPWWAHIVRFLCGFFAVYLHHAPIGINSASCAASGRPLHLRFS